MLLEDLRLYAIANDSKRSLQEYYMYEQQEEERKHLERCNNKIKSNILDLGETKRLLIILREEKEDSESEHLQMYYDGKVEG